MLNQPHKSARRAIPQGDPELAEKNRQVWDMVLHLVHPAFIYVLLQLLILSRLWDSELLRTRHPASVLPLAIYLGQFLGAWCVFYTTLLRDMGLRSRAGTLLLLGALAGFLLQFLLFSEVRQAEPSGVAIFLLIQGALALGLWATTMLHWRRLKRSWAQGDSEPGA